jgi:uncharacterized protein (DUF58 family)
MTGRWHPSVALLSGAASAAALLFLAVAMHRPDLVVLAAPVLTGLVVNLVASLVPRRDAELSATFQSAASTLFEDQGTVLRLKVAAPAGSEVLTASVSPGRLLALTDPASAAVLPSEAAGSTVVDFGVRARRWGRASVGTARVVASSAQGLLRCDTTASGVAVRIVPYRELFEATDALPITSGIVGAHRSRRIGEGTDLAGVRPFMVGDRLKRINWPVSLRTQTLHVTATVTDLDATIMLVLDSSTDVLTGDEPVPIGGTLDTAVHAAASIAEHYLRAGDRVGIVDDGHTMRTVLPAAGRHHLDRIVDALLDVDTGAMGRREPMQLAHLLSRIAPRAMIILISPLIELARAELAVEIASAGHPVLVIDSLGERAPTGQQRPSTELAWRLQRLQHELDIDRLADFGIPAVPWRGAASINAVLGSLSRATAAPRMRR